MTTHLLEWPKSRTLITNTGKGVKQQELSFIAGGNAKWYRHFGTDSLVVSYKTKHSLTIQVWSCSLVFTQRR